jgi:hypothetical protein
MKTRLVISVLTFVLFFVASAFAEINIKAEVNNTSITTNDNLTYKLVITSTEKNIPSPQIPKFEGFDVLSQAQSSTFSLAKSNIKTTLVFSYILAPKEKGKFKIEPAVIKIKDKVFSSTAFEIEVKQGALPSLPPQQEQKTEEPQITL